MAEAMRHLPFCSTIRALDLIVSLIAVAWGLWLLVPWWEVFDVSTSYDAFSVLPENAWGLIAFLVGAAQLASVLSCRRKARRATAMVATGFWCFVVMAFVLGDFRSTATAIYPFIALANMVVFLRLNPAGNKEQ